LAFDTDVCDVVGVPHFRDLSAPLSHSYHGRDMAHRLPLDRRDWSTATMMAPERFSGEPAGEGLLLALLKVNNLGSLLSL